MRFRLNFVVPSHNLVGPTPSYVHCSPTGSPLRCASTLTASVKPSELSPDVISDHQGCGSEVSSRSHSLCSTTALWLKSPAAIDGPSHSSTVPLNRAAFCIRHSVSESHGIWTP